MGKQTNFLLERDPVFTLRSWPSRKRTRIVSATQAPLMVFFGVGFAYKDS